MTLFALNTPHNAPIVNELFDHIDNLPLGQTSTMGLIYQNNDQGFKMAPPDLETNPPRTLRQAREVAETMLKIEKYDGIQYGAKLKRTVAIGHSCGGKIGDLASA